MMNIKYLLNDYRLEERMTPITAIEEYIDDYLYVIGTRIGAMDTLTEAMRSKLLFKPEIDLSPNRQKLIRNLVDSLQKLPRDHYFYTPTSTVPESLKPYFIELMYTIINELTPQRVLKQISMTRGRESIFIQYYNGVMNLNLNVANDIASLSFDYNGENIIIGKDGENLQAYYLRTNEKIIKRWADPKGAKGYLNHNLKSVGGESIGDSYLMRDFRIPSNQYKNAIIKHPLGITAFPDYILDMAKVDGTVRQFMFDTIKKPYSNYVFIDVKASIPATASKGGGNERLRYPKVRYIDEKIKQFGIAEESIFNMIPASEYTPIQFDYDKFILLLKFWINSDPKNSSLYFSDDIVNILYQEVGSNTSTRAKYYTIDYKKDDTFSFVKASNVRYALYRDKIKLADIVFYAGDNAKKITQSMLDSIEGNPWFLKDDNTVNKSKVIYKFFPISEWKFMWQWNTASLREIDLPDYESTLKRSY